MTGKADAALNVKPAPGQEQTLVNPLDQGLGSNKNESELIQGIVSTETKEEEGNILEAAPELDMSLLQDLQPPKSVLLLSLKILFVFVLVFGLTSITFFSSQLSSSLDFITAKFEIPNASRDLIASNSEIIKLKTDLNVNKILQVKAYLDEFSYFGDSYVQNYEIVNSQTVDSADQEKAMEDMQYLRSILRESYLAIMENYSAKYAAPIFTVDEATEADSEQMFRQELVEELQSKANQFNNNSAPEARREYKNYMNTINLVGNNQLYNLIAGADFDAMNETELYAFVKEVNKLTVNDLSIIQQIRENRIRWSDIMNEIELRTIAVDKYYNSGSYDLLGGIRYTSYDIDSNLQQVAIIGETKRFDTINFTMISNLIDELNRSNLFTNAEMRSFSKSGSIETGYTASLRLTLDLKDAITGEKKVLGNGLASGFGNQAEAEAALDSLINEL